MTRKVLLLPLAFAGVLAACGPREKPLRLQQRSDHALAPGVVLRIGDVEMEGDVRLTVLEKGSVVAQRKLRGGETFEVRTAGASWEVVLTRLEQHLLEEDYVHLFVRRK